ncbi:UV-stimulated scaffold protein A [Narcine bancroftii]|uniref:UV-stimulated scaffold protein A n=1 Tax=Narcine bancroftii TaxID=1343680 RepID=UPI00383171CE
MEAQQDEKLLQLVEDLTTSGQQVPNPEKMKELKKICKSSEEYVKHAYHLIMRQLNQEHAEIRLSAFQIANELFMRSNQFRTLLVSNFQEFLELTMETDYEQPLPPPKATAQKLKEMAVKAVQEWQDRYGNAYKKLSLGYHFLKQIKKVDFQDVRVRTQAERKREEERLKRLENINKVRVLKVEEEMKEMSEEIQNTLTELETCFKLLLPHLSEFSCSDMSSQYKQESPDKIDDDSSTTRRQREDHRKTFDYYEDEQPCSSKELDPLPLLDGSPEEQESDEDQDDLSQSEESESEQLENNEETFIRNHGLLSHKYSLNLEIHTDLKIKEDEDNSAVINNIKDFQRLINNKYLPTVQYWIQTFTKAGISDARLRRAIDLKRAMDGALKKHDEMNISYTKRLRKVMKATDEEEDGDDDDDFVEVPEKEGYEPHIQEDLREEYGLEPLIQKTKEAVKKETPSAGPPTSWRNDEELDPTCAAATLKIWKQQLSSQMYSLPGTSKDNILASKSAGPKLSSEDARKRKMEEEMRNAPMMPFGLDLQYWGEEQSTSGKILKVHTPHRFWGSKEMDDDSENEEMAALLKTRYITFAGKFEPVKHKCRAPMPNGSLCERQDRFKCPFHGKIISRDEQGNPVNPEDRQRLEKEEQRKQKEKAVTTEKFNIEASGVKYRDLGGSVNKMKELHLHYNYFVRLQDAKAISQYKGLNTAKILQSRSFFTYKIKSKPHQV